MQRSDQASNNEFRHRKLVDVLDRTMYQYERLIQEQRLMVERLRQQHSGEPIPPATDFSIRRAA